MKASIKIGTPKLMPPLAPYCHSGTFFSSDVHRSFPSPSPLSNYFTVILVTAIDQLSTFKVLSTNLIFHHFYEPITSVSQKSFKKEFFGAVGLHLTRTLLV